MSCVQVSMPIHVFEISMLNPDNYGPESTRKIFVISTDEWIKMQAKAASLLNSEISQVVTKRVVQFWEDIINGVVPYGLRVTTSDPITNLR